MKIRGIEAKRELRRQINAMSDVEAILVLGASFQLLMPTHKRRRLEREGRAMIARLAAQYRANTPPILTKEMVH